MRPFRIDIPDAELDDLRHRLARTRWPEPATVPGWTQGVPLDYARELCNHWARAYDWRRCEAELNALPQLVTPLDGGGPDTVDVHVLHAPSPHPDALPLLLTHGWPGSVVEFLDVLPALTDPPDPRDAFHVVAPTLPGFGFSGKPAATGWGVERIARAWAQLMERLGHDRYGAHGGDWGSMVTAALGSLAPAGLAGVHLTLPLARRPRGADPADLQPEDRAALADRARFETDGTGYSRQQATRPQTLGYGLTDSPAGQCMWVVEKFFEWTDCDGHPEHVIARDRLLDNVMLYWLPAAAASSARIYWESFDARVLDPVHVPAGATVFPRELNRVPRAWLETRFTDLRHYSRPERGGHFASLEQPAVLVEELRAFFRLVR
ncbi:MAG: epoxide hydrolase family protein [Pseudonocardia sp.]